MTLKKILVPTDFSDAAAKAYEQAVALASRDGVEIHLLHRLASTPPMFPPVAQPGGGSTWREIGPLLDEFTSELREEAARKLEELEKRAPGGVPITTSVEERLEPYEAILHEIREWKPDLVAMGTHGRQGLDRLLMGSVASSVLHRADAPVMLARADSELYDGQGDLGRILVPIDFSDYSHRALGFARVLAKRFGGALHVLHVVELLHTPFKPGGLTSRFEEEPTLRDKYREALEGLLSEGEGEVTVAEGTVAGEILWWREKLGAQMVVMGSRGLSGLERLVVGSVAEKTARFCEVPVIVVK